MLAWMWKHLRRITPICSYPFLSVFYRRSARRAIRRLAEQEGKQPGDPQGAAVPPAALRFRSAGVCTIEQFVQFGRASRESFEAGLHRVNRSLQGFSDALDFGCGCGRALTAFPSRPAGLKLYGTDIDPDAVEWCQEHLPFAECAVNEPLPPLRYDDGAFDLIWAVSVFTHLAEDAQFQWLGELERVLRPNGVLLATVHGRHTWEGLPPWTVRKIRRRGFVYVRTSGFRGFLPEWYQNTWHTQAYVEDHWARYLRVLAYIPRGMGGYQDMVVLGKKDAG